jgi:site-specific DNA-methyltransferase (adenine-specific)
VDIAILVIMKMQKWIHPTIKPISIIRTIIRNSSKEGDIVLDCFLGSGTTAVACILENRNYIGIEINKKYYDIAIERINETKESDS